MYENFISNRLTHKQIKVGNQKKQLNNLFKKTGQQDEVDQHLSHASVLKNFNNAPTSNGTLIQMLSKLSRQEEFFKSKEHRSKRVRSSSE